MIGYEPRFQRDTRYGSLRESIPGAWSSSQHLRRILIGNKSELSHNNDGTATVSVSHYTQCIVAGRRVRRVTFNNDGTVTVRVSHYKQCTAT